MARPRKAVRPVEKSISLPQDLADRIELLLWSELEGRVPHGAFSRFVEAALRAAVQKGSSDVTGK